MVGKKLLVPTLIILFSVCVNTYAQNHKKEIEIQMVDSVISYQLYQLEKIANLKVGDTLIFNPPFDVASAINFFEKLTKVISFSDGYFTKTSATPVIVKKWRDWVSENRSLIIWEKKRKRINRKDINIYR